MRMDNTRQQRRAKWRELLKEQLRGGQNVKAFCRERGIRTSSFYGWKKRLGLAESGPVAVSTDKPSSSERDEAAGIPVRFLEVQVAAATEPTVVSPLIEVRLSQGRSLMVGPGFDAVHLARLLSVLESVASLNISVPVARRAES